MAEKTEFSLAGFSYQHFYWVGKTIGKLYNNEQFNLGQTLQDAGLRMYPAAYASILGFFFIVSIILVIPVILLTGFIFAVFAPFLVLLLGYAVPLVMAHDRAQKLDLEVPFAGTYISVMATGGMSPYASMRRLKECALLPNISKTINDMEIDVEIRGIDPVSAMEKSAQGLPSKDYKELMLGYASTMRTGGDVLHYLLVRTETMFKDLAVKVKTFGERASMLMETYVTLSILMTLMLTVMYMTSLSFESYWGGNSDIGIYLIYGYFLTPFVALLFIFIADSQQLSQPLNDWRTYKAFFASIPIFIFLVFVLFIPFAAPDATLPFAGPFVSLVTGLRQAVGLERGYEAGIGMGIALLAVAIIGTVAHSYYNRKNKDTAEQVTHFMRDLTEARKTGSSPESCMENLAGRKYGKFTPILAAATRQIRWGFPFKVIYETFKTKINSWLALINIFLLVDAVEVGGGTTETLETLTHFSEELTSIEKERKSSQRPLLFLPYLGVGILIFSTLVFLAFSKTLLMSFSHQTIPFSQVVTLLLPPLMVQIFFMGLVTGKLSGGTTSNGFKHALILTALGLVFIPLAGYLTMPFIGGS
jgi:archaeal flagellar protein FlaJ